MKLIKLLLVAGLFLIPVTGMAQKMSADDVVAKHLESLGPKAARDAVTSRVVLADVLFTLKGSAKPLTGKAVLLSAGQKNLWGMNFDSNDYPQDKFGYDGKNVKVAFVRPGIYSTMGGFLRSYKELMREGLLGGTLMSSWAMSNTAKNKPKLSYDGEKTIDGVQTHVLEYMPKGGTDLSIKLYFDAKDFRHLRTEYGHTIAARQGTTVDSSAGQSPDRYKVVEDFSNFQKVNGLTVPQGYKLFYSYSGSSSVGASRGTPREFEWALQITNIGNNQEFDPSSFDIASN